MSNTEINRLPQSLSSIMDSSEWNTFGLFAKEYSWIVLPVAWILISFFLSFLSGWWTLSTVFKSRCALEDGWLGETVTFRWIVKYPKLVTINADHNALYLDTIFFLKAGHPTLTIPWGYIDIEEYKNRCLFTINNMPGISFSIASPLCWEVLKRKRVVEEEEDLALQSLEVRERTH
jgi:hypothetical protein